MYTIELSQKAIKDLHHLTPVLADQIQAKLRFFEQSGDPMQFSKKLVHLPPATHRFRIGKLRVKFFCDEKKIIITGIDFRDRVYF